MCSLTSYWKLEMLMCSKPHTKVSPTGPTFLQDLCQQLLPLQYLCIHSGPSPTTAPTARGLPTSSSTHRSRPGMVHVHVPPGCEKAFTYPLAHCLTHSSTADTSPPSATAIIQRAWMWPHRGAPVYATVKHTKEDTQLSAVGHVHLKHPLGNTGTNTALLISSSMGRRQWQQRWLRPRSRPPRHSSSSLSHHPSSPLQYPPRIGAATNLPSQSPLT